MWKLPHSQVVMHHHYKVTFVRSTKLNTEQQICQKRPSPQAKKIIIIGLHFLSELTKNI